MTEPSINILLSQVNSVYLLIAAKKLQMDG